MKPIRMIHTISRQLSPGTIQNNKGFTLIELMIASAISLVVLSSALGAGIALQRVNTDQQDLMSLQSALTFVEKILTQELERAGTGMAQVAIMGYNQTNSSDSSPKVAITIQNITQSDESACTSNNCSRLIIYSGNLQRALQINEITADGFVATGSIGAISYWKNDHKSLKNFFIVDAKSGVQCLFEDVTDSQLLVSSGGGSDETKGTLTVHNLTNLTTGTTTCDLTLFKSGTSFAMPIRATAFLTNGYTINGSHAYIDPTLHQPRLMYIPDIYDDLYQTNGTLTWLELSREMESLNIQYTIFKNADPTQTREWILDNDSNVQRFNPTLYNSSSHISSLMNDYSLQPFPDSTANILISMFDPSTAPEAFSIPLLRRIAQIELGLVLRKKCREADKTKCTSGSLDLDNNGGQVRTITRRINAHNISLIALNEFIRG